MMGDKKTSKKTGNALMRLAAIFSTLILTYAIISLVASADTNSTTNSNTLTLTGNVTPTLTGNIYYVAKNGNDSDPGTEDKPFKTIQRAADIAIAGDTVYVKNGTYNEYVKVKNSGSPDMYITFAAYPGHDVTIDGNGLSMSFWQGLIDIDGYTDGKGYIKISGFKIINSPQAGIHADKTHHIIIENNYIYNTELSAIKVGWGNSSNIIIDNNTIDRPKKRIWDLPTYSGPSVNKGWEETISLSFTDIAEIKNNTVLQNGKGECITIKDGTSHAKIYGNIIDYCSAVGIYIAGWEANQSDAEAYQNKVSGANMGIMIASEKGAVVQGVKVYNNIVYENRDHGITVSSYSAGPEYPPVLKDISIMNNIVDRNGGKGRGGSGIIIERDRGYNMRVSNVTIRNNIASNNTDAQIAVESGLPYVENTVIDHNLVYGKKGYYENDGANSITSDPQYTNYKVKDFHPRSTSPSIDNGSPIDAPIVDFDGISRPQGAGFDIGAYEFVSP